MNHDEAERNQALTPHQSFIVQAPAGSGKTELLTQRFLVLLSHVKKPEEIIAITFTKKSAAEMRIRILNSLKSALVNDEPSTPHAKKTWVLAKKALAQDKLLKWNLLENPNQLRIQTIDSFNAMLTKHLPILSQFGATPDITTDPLPLYKEAAQEFLSHLEENVAWADSIATLLIHMDNDLNQLEILLINLLAKRDQWLPYINNHTESPDLKNKLENHLRDTVADIIFNLTNIFPANFADELLFLARFAAHNLIQEKNHSAITRCLNFVKLPGSLPEEINDWLALTELLLKKDNTWRKQFDKSLGFMPASFFKNSSEKTNATEMKQRMETLINKLNQQHDLLTALVALRQAPAIFYQKTQWKTLKALHQALKILVAQLKLIFQKYGKIDYIENAEAALLALGHDDTPTDLTLSLDYQIKHILIDEFQDTSHSQYRLIEKLISGWETNDGRTLFLVGDPMQSIYRFREADVGLFIRARKKGIGSVSLIPLILSVNFRSTNGIVSWINKHFPTIFPAFDNIATGAVSYSPSFANDKSETKKSVELHPGASAQELVDLIKKIKQKNPTESIAILVRSRTHLASIIPALKSAHLSYQAIKIDPLSLRPFIQDLMALTRALLHTADKIAWLSLLRSPFAGLSLDDLLILSGNNSQISLWENLQSDNLFAALSPEGKIILNRILPILKRKLNERRRYSLRAWIESTWLLLGGSASLQQEADLNDTTAYFSLLEKLDQGSDLLTFDLLKDHVEKLYATPDHTADPLLQIMTIHNAKGLEFDTVILPHLERKASHDDKQLLLWMERPLTNEKSALIMAPIHAIGDQNDSIYDYIKLQQAIKTHHETSRLLYVAVTRAKRQLHLFFNLNTRANPGSLLDTLWDTIKHDIIPSSFSAIENNTATTPSIKTCTRRLIPNWQNPIEENRLANDIYYHQKNTGFQFPDYQPKLIGTLIHQILQQLTLFGISWWTDHFIIHKNNYLTKQLTQLGLSKHALPSAIDIIHKAINNTLADPRGQWILHAHTQASSELHLTAMIEGIATPLIIDRTFIDDKKIRWIIDYKTTLFTEEDISVFLTAEQKKYQKKMWAYYQAMHQLDSHPIKMGLYFPLMSAWHEWEF